MVQSLDFKSEVFLNVKIIMTYVEVEDLRIVKSMFISQLNGDLTFCKDGLT